VPRRGRNLGATLKPKGSDGCRGEEKPQHVAVVSRCADFLVEVGGPYGTTFATGCARLHDDAQHCPATTPPRVPGLPAQRGERRGELQPPLREGQSPDMTRPQSAGDPPRSRQRHNLPAGVSTTRPLPGSRTSHRRHRRSRSTNTVNRVSSRPDGTGAFGAPSGSGSCPRPEGLRPTAWRQLIEEPVQLVRTAGEILSTMGEAPPALCVAGRPTRPSGARRRIA
jgi:hypothetical protein